MVPAPPAAAAAAAAAFAAPAPPRPPGRAAALAPRRPSSTTAPSSPSLSPSPPSAPAFSFFRTPRAAPPRRAGAAAATCARASAAAAAAAADDHDHDHDHHDHHDNNGNNGSPNPNSNQNMALTRLVTIVRAAADRARAATVASPPTYPPSSSSPSSSSSPAAARRAGAARPFGMGFGLSLARSVLPFGGWTGTAAGTAAKCSSGFTLSDDEVDAIHAAMLDLRPEDLGFPATAIPNPAVIQTSPPPISYIHVAENDDMLMAIFVLPPGATIPTHSHPNTFVFTRVLFGELIVREYDFVSPQQQSARVRPDKRNWHSAVRRPVSVARAGDARYLTPTAGNVHSFTAKQWTAVFDMIVPPYASPNRVCRYYADVVGEIPDPASVQDSREELVTLKEISCPDSYATEVMAYRGTPVRLY